VVLFMGGSGLVNASASALPGENLYPVKLTWENVRIFLAFNEGSRETLKRTFEDERLREVAKLLEKGRQETIHFFGIYRKVNDITYVSGIRIVISDTTELPPEPLQNGASVEVTGQTDANGFVEAKSIKLLPGESRVPLGLPVKIAPGRTDNSENDMHNDGDYNGRGAYDSYDNNDYYYDDANDDDYYDGDDDYYYYDDGGYYGYYDGGGYDDDGYDDYYYYDDGGYYGYYDGGGYDDGGYDDYGYYDGVYDNGGYDDGGWGGW
jgi:hypothetical protein